MALTLPAINYREIGGGQAEAIAVRLVFPARDIELRHWYARLTRRPAESGTASGTFDTLVWEVRDDNNGQVGNTILAWGSVPFDDYTMPLYKVQWVGFHYVAEPTVVLTAGTPYWFVIRTNDWGRDKKEAAYWLDTGADTGQTRKYRNGGIWNNLLGKDLAIKVLDEQAGAVWDVVIDEQGYMTADHHKSTVTATAQAGVLATRGGQSAHSQFRYPYSTFSQDDFSHGLGQLVLRDMGAYKFGVQADTRIAGQVLIGPFTQLTTTAATQEPKHLPPSSGAVYVQRELPNQATDPNSAYKYYAVRFQWPTIGGDVGNSITSLGVWFRKVVASPASQVFVEIWSHDAVNNQPSAMLRSVEFTSYAQDYLHFKGLPVTSLTVTAGTYYWLVVRVQYSGVLGVREYEFLAEPHATPVNTKRSKDGTGWADYDCDLYYVINPPSNAGLAANANVAGFVEFGGNLYTAAGTKIFRWNGTTWDTVYSSLAANATTILDFGGYLYVAVGTNTLYRSSDGNTWNTVSGPPGVNVYRLFKALGFLFAVLPTTDANAYRTYKTSDGVNWSAAIEVGSPGAYISAILPWKDTVHIVRSDGRTYYLDKNDLAIFRFDIGATSDAGDQTTVWSDMLFVPSLSGLVRWSGGLVEIIQPDFEGGIPPKFRGRITALASTLQALYCAVTPHEAYGQFAIYAYNGVGWHPVGMTLRHKASSGRPQRVYALYAQPIANGVRLWVAEDNFVQYLNILDNPWESSNTLYVPEGWLTTSWWDGGVHDAQKYFSRVRVVADGLRNDSTAQTRIEVFYALDEESNWRFLGRITPTRDTLAFPDDTTGQTIRFLFILQTNNPQYTPRLRYYTAEAVVRAVPGYVHSVRILLAYPLTDLKGVRHTDRTAQQMYQALRQAAAKDAPILISTPWETVQAMITNITVSGGSVQREGPTKYVQWERLATVSFVEV